jgi:2-keto-4-pentenoate hydratase/2-oxohepta-3-ene-1,7-dioic acid hydratase in catechol pathway
LGPWLTTEINPGVLKVMALQGDKVRQNYPVSDMIFSPMKIVSLMSHYQILLPGDLIYCGTSVGARTMKPGSSIDILIPGIGKLSSQFEDLSE